MSTDVSAILYSVINEIGRDKIRVDISADIAVSQIYCQQILERCRAMLGDRENAQTVAAICEGLLHFMLTASILPSQRKLSIQGSEIDIVIPSAKALAKAPEKSIIIQVIKSDMDLSKVAGAERLQPISENIWIISSTRLESEHRYYNFDGDKSFAKIVKDIHAFVTSKGISGLKLFHGE